ncbi:hypothetical protein CABS01_15273 [Colletotrichum abscissum]|nr:uncharacterized protein CABS01_15273 [Colletotrichum abscissum]KAK1476738.1 hypothetical protein CABS01_15273 [Colletotrichum abscissum]
MQPVEMMPKPRPRQVFSANPTRLSLDNRCG